MANVLVYLDSPMAIAVTDLYRKHAREHRLTPEETRTLVCVRCATLAALSADHARSPT